MGNLFIDSQLPQPFEHEELIKYFIKMKNGDLSAREEIITHNIRLVISNVIEKFSNTSYDQEELVSVGICGLIKSVDSFDLSRGIKFSTYAERCIHNEILFFMRKNNNYVNNDSFDKVLLNNKNGKELKLEDIIADKNIDFVTDYEVNELNSIIRSIVFELPEFERNIVIKYFGFNDNDPITQQEIANSFGCTRSYISRMVRKVLQKLRIKLQKQDVIEKQLIK